MKNSDRSIKMLPKLNQYINDLQPDMGSIPPNRKEKLKEIASYIRSKKEDDQTAKLNFICTHNSRRSQLAQIWASTAAAYFTLENVESYSGGTEATAFNPRAVAAIERAGFEVESSGGDNPEYTTRYSNEAQPILCFSKKFDDEFNPDKNFAAIMTCSDADENCPFVPGAEFRKPITYSDPKESDGTGAEKEVYDKRCRQIAAEMLYMMSQL